MSAQGPAPGRIGKRKGAGGVGVTDWELPERGSARARCVLGWGGAHLGTPRRFRQREVVRRAQSTVASGRMQGAFERSSGHIEHGPRRRFQTTSPERTGRLFGLTKARGVAWPPGHAKTKMIVALDYAEGWGAPRASDGATMCTRNHSHPRKCAAATTR